MQNLQQTLKNWNLERGILTSPPITEKKLFLHIKQMLIRAWIHADCNEQHGIIRITLRPAEPVGKSNIEKLEKLNITF